jgi:hypothetical protein
MRKRKEKPMRADYSDVDLGTGVRGKYLQDYYALSDREVAPGKSVKAKKPEASPPRSRKRRQRP